MRIVFDMQGAQTESRLRGIGRYSVALAKAIARQASQHEVWVSLNSCFPQTLESVRGAFDGLVPADRIVEFHIPRHVAGCNPDDRWRRQAAELVREAFIAELRPDIVHISSLFEGTFDPAVLSVGRLELVVPTAVTQYDLIPLLNSDDYLGNDHVRSWYADKLNSLRKADLLLAISEHARQEAIDAGKIDPSRVTNISSACAAAFRQLPLAPDSRLALLARYGIRLPYVMYSGAFDTRKNLGRLVEAFALLPTTVRESHQLLLVGRSMDVERVDLERAAEKLNVVGQVVFTGHVPDEDLIALFNQCAVFVFPSLHEGFGLPALEAMACGAPTIGSNRTSIPEVIGRPDALFDPTDPTSISEKIAQVLGDTAFRESLRAHGLRQSANFSWETSARRALEAFEEIASRRPNRASTDWDIELAERRSAYDALVAGIAAIPRGAVAPSDEDLAELAISIARNRDLTDRLARRCDLPESIHWRIEGPFDSSYSLALLNRETARALEGLGHRVALHSTEGPGDIDPRADFLTANPDLARLHARSAEVSSSHVHVTSRNLYPPRVADMRCRMNLLHHFAWEESGFPAKWSEAFNAHLQGITCLSRHVEKLLVDHGVTVPLSVSGCGVDHWERVEADNSFSVTARGFRFLHVSSCFPRKGADALLKAYGQAFRSCDDVTLVIKTFPNPHNEIHRWLNEARAEISDYPDVVIIEDDLTDGELKSLYRQCHVLVAPSRAEGFALPLAEGLLSGLAVIATGWGGQLDFCNEETSWLVDYRFEPARTHFNLFGSVWAAPDIADLARAMREVHSVPTADRVRRAQRGRKLLLEHFRWEHVAQRLVNSARDWSRFRPVSEPRIGWISTFNTRCGIATYSEHLIEHLPADVTVFAARTTLLTRPDGPEVMRCWNSGGDDRLDALRDAISSRTVDTLVVQFNYGFFEFEHLSRFLVEQVDLGRVVVVMLHSTTDPNHVAQKRLASLRDALRRCHRVLVHAVGDLNRLKDLGLTDNVTLFPHGIADFGTQSIGKGHVRPTTTFTVASYGFFLPHKGLLELIEAVDLLRKEGLDVRLKMVNSEYPIEESAELIRHARRMIEELGLAACVQLETNFLSDEESLRQLSEADLLVFPYQQTGESASGAVRYGLSTGIPVAVTPSSIFSDVAAAVFQLPGSSPREIADGIQALLREIEGDSDLYRARRDAAVMWRHAHLYSGLSRRLAGMLTALKQQLQGR